MPHLTRFSNIIINVVSNFLKQFYIVKPSFENWCATLQSKPLHVIYYADILYLKNFIIVIDRLISPMQFVCLKIFIMYTCYLYIFIFCPFFLT